MEIKNYKKRIVDEKIEKHLNLYRNIVVKLG